MRAGFSARRSWHTSVSARHARLLYCMFIILLAACGANDRNTPPPPPTAIPPALLNVGLSENAAALAPLWAEGYAAETEDASVNFVSGNNTTLFEDLMAAQLDAVLVHHIPETLQAETDLWFNPVALDALLTVVHPQNVVTSLTTTQIRALFSGEIGNWAGVGGPDLAVTPLEQEHGDGARTVFTRRVMGSTPVSINTIVQSDSASLLKTVAAEPGAIGYTTLSAVNDSVQAVTVDGVAPTTSTAATQDYPLTVPLYFVSRGEPQGALRAFLAWLQSDEGQAIVSEKVGTVR